MYGKTVMTCFDVPVWFRSHCIFECYTLCGYRVSTLVIRLPQPPTTGSPPPLCMAAEPSPIWKRILAWLSYHTNVKK
jgi:hypothetical protein